ncbi:hypothetical protein M758_4G063400 [Ceratodon purpureus]|nr:hypothetical protein M758_4G063400 [Ceratodon purpureus]
MERISVAIRVKPTSRQEVSNGSQWKVAEKKIWLQNEFGACIKGQSYTFDKIFGTSIRNGEIYEHAKDLVLSAVLGFNGTVLAYGQTSSGKTYTMQGSTSDPGVIRLAIQDVFISIDKIEDREFLVRVSYMEIYNEEINDLLAPDNRKLQIYESLEKGTFVAGLREEIADSVEQVIAVLERGEAQRQFAETDMNLNSSRSHTIFRMVIESRDKSHDYRQDNDPTAQDAVRVSTLNLVDLAGSERFSKSGAEGARSKEGAHINKSLTTLGIVINKLSEGGGKQGSHVPYRDSRLTRILQSALGGNARTAIICTINPDEIHIDETRSTLQFASRAKRVTNCAQVNEILTDAALLKRQKEEIKELRRRLEGSPHTEDLKKEVLHLRNDLLKYELGRERLELELQQEMKAQVERERRIKEQEQRIESLSTLVISGAGAIEDRELPPKKGYRRQTWCPQSTTSNTIEQGLPSVNSGNDNFSESVSIEVSLQPLATPRNKTASESVDDDEVDSFWSNSSELDSLPAFGDYQNIADGDIWTSLNRDAEESADDAYENTWGNANVRPINGDSELSHTSSEFENYREFKQARLPSLVNSSSQTSMLQDQLNKRNFQCEELPPSTEFEIQEKTKEVIATANIALLEEKLRFQKQEFKKILSNMKDMEIELKACHLENTQLRAKTVNLHEQLRTRAPLEQGVQDRAFVDEENEIFKQNLCTLDMKSSLHLANHLGNELLQVLHSIENRDLRSLDDHTASEETVGKSLKALQVTLLESAHVGLRLFSNLSSKEPSLASTKLQQLIQEVANIGVSTFQENCGATEKTPEIDPDHTQLVLNGSVYSIHSTHDTAIRQGMNSWSIDSMAVRNSVGQSNTWYQSLDDASLSSSQDPGEDICNIDLHQACDDEQGEGLSSHSDITDMQMPDKEGISEMNQEYLLKVQVDEHFAEELKIMRNMSEAEKQFTKELLHKVKALEAALTVAEMEIIEYKVEIEHLQMNNLRTSLDASLHCDDWELQNLRVECEIQKEEIRQLMEQVMTPDHELERESLLRETMERNKFLENCLREAEMRLIRAKGWLEELLQLRNGEIRREITTHLDVTAPNIFLVNMPNIYVCGFMYVYNGL